MEALKVHQGGNRRTRRQRAIDLLTQVGIPDPASRLDVYPHQLSGGMSQRVMIAMAIACRPKLLIADEPTTALDVTIQAQIIELLLALQQRENMALVLITHDLALVAEAAHKIIVMYAGQVVEAGLAGEIFHTPRHPYTQALLRALPEFAVDGERLVSLPGVVPGKYDRPTGCLLNPRCPYATERCRQEEPALRSLNGARGEMSYSTGRCREADRMSETRQQLPLLQAVDLKKHYPVKGGLFTPQRLVKALDGVSFSLERGKTLAVVGESGCGKSTLGRLLTMIETPSAGELYYQGQDLLQRDPAAQKLRRQKIQIVFQNPYASLNPRKKIGALPGGAAGDQHDALCGGAPRTGVGDDGAGRLEDGALRSLSTYVLRRPAPAYRHCAWLDAQSRCDDRR
ncbi:Glutathione import ATP-binding protein GsiA [Edwardsiella tarda]|nr:Glutathione import ATP-binding protein GsiA [Edwardsiella tarda]